jgi:hypothetical protein
MPYAAMRDTHAADLAHQAAATSPVVLWYGTWHVARGFGGVVDLLERHGLVFKVAFVRPNEEEVVHLDASSLTVGDVLGLPDSRMASEVCDVLLAPKPQLLTVAPSDLPVPDVFEERRRTALINGMLDRLRSTPTS